VVVLPRHRKLLDEAKTQIPGGRFQIGPINLPSATPDQIKYLERIRAAGEDYDGSTIIGGPKRKANDMAGTFWVIETARQTYWDGRKVGERAVFSEKLKDAIKFLDSESADCVRCWLLERQPEQGGVQVLRAVEHSYIPEIVS